MRTGRSERASECGDRLGYRVSVHDESCDVSAVRYVLRPQDIERVVGELHGQLDAIVWAVARYDIPPSWQSAYYRVGGRWPWEDDHGQEKAD